MIIEEKDLKVGELPINKIIHGDALSVLKKLPSNSIDCVITSPPYWSKRFYGDEVKSIFGGDPNCDHEWVEFNIWQDNLRFRGKNASVGANRNPKIFANPNVEWLVCKKCGAMYGQLGMEQTPELYIEHLIEIFREVKRVLKPHGNLFVILDDTYSQSGKGFGSIDPKYPDGRDNIDKILPNRFKIQLPQKTMCLVPELFAIKMVYEEGWILRNKIIWAKKINLYKDITTIGNAMPESVKDRLCHTWEYVYHFVKEPKYWYDLDAVRVPHKDITIKRLKFGFNPENWKWKDFVSKGHNPYGTLHPLGANPGDVIQINVEPFKDCHFAVFPTKLVEFLIKVGCPQYVCKKCGMPREKIYERVIKTGNEKVVSGKYVVADNLTHSAGAREHYYTTIRRFIIPKSMQVAFAKWLRQYTKGNEDILDKAFGEHKWRHWIRTDNSGACLPDPEDYNKLKQILNLPNTWDKWLLETITTLVDDSGNSYRLYGWSEYCKCGSTLWTPGIVLDPFLGSGTTALVALKMGRGFIGVELNYNYCQIALKRIKPYLPQQTLSEFL